MEGTGVGVGRTSQVLLACINLRCPETFKRDGQPGSWTSESVPGDGLGESFQLGIFQHKA